MTTDPRVKFRWNELTGARSGAWVPVVQDGRCVAVLAVSWNTPRQRPLRARDRAAAAARLRGRDHDPAHRPARPAAVLRAHRRADRACRTGASGTRTSSARSRARAATAGTCAWRCSTSTASRPSTTTTATRAATSCWRRPRPPGGPVLRTTDTLARYGGEEFAVLLPHSDEEGAMTVVGRLLEVVPLGQTASAGVAVWDGKESADRAARARRRRALRGQGRRPRPRAPRLGRELRSLGRDDPSIERAVRPGALSAAIRRGAPSSPAAAATAAGTT